MPTPRALPDVEILREHRRNKMTMQEIANLYGVSKQAVHKALRDATPSKMSEHPRERYDDLIPWRVSADDMFAYEAIMLRQLARRKRGLPVHRTGRGRMYAEDARLDRWLSWLEQSGQVVDYDRGQGWRYVPRQPTDGPDPIRRPVE